MPPKIKFTKEDIVNAALEIIIEEGFCLTARKIAKKMDSSTRPIYSNFDSLREIEKDVIKRSHEIFLSYLIKDENTKVKDMGIGYVKFARDYKNLFKIMFLENKLNLEIKNMKNLPEESKIVIDIMKTVSEHKQKDIDEINMLFFKRWIYVHGLAVLISSNQFKDTSDVFINKIIDSYTDKD